MSEKLICVVGLGYVGLPTSAVLASRGYRVHGVESDAEAARVINSGRAHIVEPELDRLVQAAVVAGTLKAHPEPTVADVFLICVPTPLKGTCEPDLSHVESATRSIAPFLKAGDLVILESTCPPGTTERVAQWAKETRGALDIAGIYFSYAPERVLPGQILREVVENDRIIGGLDEASGRKCAEFYKTFVTGRVHLTTARMAETVKLVENASRDVGIAFANELSLVADAQGLNVWELIRLANYHPRVNILSPGPGVGGHCIAVDPCFLIHAQPNLTPLMRAARAVNESKPDWVVDKVRACAQKFKKPTIACLGLAYKPDIDDLRGSPALRIARQLARLKNVQLHVVEPNLKHHPEFELVSLETALSDADIVLILVAHMQFQALAHIALGEKFIFDVCGILV